jgi:hypothetical protein
MIRLTAPDGSPIAINPMQIFSISHIGEAGIGCAIWSAYAARHEVKESYEVVMKRVAEWGKVA